jgi:hypothetical protein
MDLPLHFQLSDDIYSIGFLSFYFLDKKEKILAEDQQTSKSILPKFDFFGSKGEAEKIHSKDIEELTNNTVIIDENVASNFFGKCLLIFTVQMIMIYFLMINFVVP